MSVPVEESGTSPVYRGPSGPLLWPHKKQTNLFCINMQFQITAIEFDCSLEDDIFDEGADPSEYWTESDRINTEQKLAEEYISQILEADDEEDLVEEITDATGWCIKSIDYRHVA